MTESFWSASFQREETEYDDYDLAYFERAHEKPTTYNVTI